MNINHGKILATEMTRCANSLSILRLLSHDFNRVACPPNNDSIT